MDKSKPFSPITLAAIDAALLAGDILNQGFGTDFSISCKSGKHNLVTEYDHKSEKAIIEFIRQNIPSSEFLAEESGRQEKKGSSILWIIDPLDGTVNFAHGIPVFSVSIAASMNGQVESGVVYQPVTHELFVAQKGHGAYLNGRRIAVTKIPTLDQAFLATGFPYNLAENPSHCIEHFTDILRLGIPIRRLGSAAIDLAYTAAGRFDGFFETRLAPWDCAAGCLLIEEAGGKTSHWNAAPFNLFADQPLLATNGLIHSEMLKRLSKT
ncbi:MAG: Inositol-1-monophosphatase [Parachlamydiales bacterium]|nr:Inositol-1-monophosphatase [Parachlamydiales bacterium]